MRSTRTRPGASPHHQRLARPLHPHQLRHVRSHRSDQAPAGRVWRRPPATCRVNAGPGRRGRAVGGRCAACRGHHAEAARRWLSAVDAARPSSSASSALVRARWSTRSSAFVPLPPAARSRRRTGRARPHLGASPAPLPPPSGWRGRVPPQPARSAGTVLGVRLQLPRGLRFAQAADFKLLDAYAGARGSGGDYAYEVPEPRERPAHGRGTSATPCPPSMARSRWTSRRRKYLQASARGGPGGGDDEARVAVASVL